MNKAEALRKISTQDYNLVHQMVGQGVTCDSQVHAQYWHTADQRLRTRLQCPQCHTTARNILRLIRGRLS